MPRAITSRDNPLLVRLRKLAQTPTAYRKAGQVWLEGDHLCRAALARGVAVPLALGTEAAFDDPALQPLLAAAADQVLLPAPLFAAISGLESPATMGFVLDLPPAAAPQDGLASVVLDGVQDAGNVGSVLRSASALGVRQVLALQGTAALWSPKVLRAGMGAHFNLQPGRGVVHGRPGRPGRCRWWPPVPTPRPCWPTPPCPRPAAGSSATKGRACRPR